MKITSATFIIESKSHGYRVEFNGASVSIFYISSSTSLCELDNSKKQWKPCATHAMDLVRKMIPGMAAKSRWTDERFRETKPALKIARDS